ncbi:MAG: manganese efflux pump MntP family protein [Myxococcota bacterium]|nr:manganese efflux pump MntP family protein [Myxococcota bacterium]
MTFGAILLLSVGLAMDATAVAAARGMAARTLRLRHVLSVSLLFGGFQALMPGIGWLVGARVGPLIQAWDHWIAFTLLSAIGGKMLWEARSEHDAEGKPALSVDQSFRIQLLLVLALATSIDALAVGFTLPMLDAPFASSLVTIGVTTAVLSALGVLAGRRFGAALGQRLDAFGGVVLIGLGLKILIEHLSAS